jgi:hypothetical protein
MNVIEKFERYSRPIHNGQDYLKNHIFGNRFPVIDKSENIKDYTHVDYVWVVDKSYDVYPSFTWFFAPDPNEPVQKHAFPVVYKDSRSIKDWDSCVLTPTKVDAENTKNHIYIFAEYDPYKSKDKFDVFYIGKDKLNFYNCKLKNVNTQYAKDIYQAQQLSTTDMFWVVYDDTIIRDKFSFSYKPDDWSLDAVHVFGNGDIDNLDGVCLVPKEYPLDKKEVDYRFFAHKKEVRILASDPKPYDKFSVNNYDEYIEAIYNSTTPMFWAVPDDVVPTEHFDFSYHAPMQNKNVTHVFLNGENYDGIALCSKDKLITEKEIEHRFFAEKIETGIVASYPKHYNRFEITSYQDYLDALEHAEQDMFWVTYPQLTVKDDFKFDFTVSIHDTFNRNINHVWRNGEFYDGVALMSKKSPVSQKEIEYRFFAHKKEHVDVASMPKPYDIIFISYNEPNADANYEKLLKKFPKAKRVDGIKGIHQAHKMAAKLSTTDMFYVVDGDAEIIDGFNFDYQVAHYDVDGKNTVHVWRSFNPINNLIYGYGGVKLLPTKLTKDMKITNADMTTSISDKFKAINRMSNSTNFNTDPFNTWKSAFRECVKLSSKTIARQNEKETQFHLEAWCTKGADKPFGEYSIAGAVAGKEYGEANKDNKDALAKINDFEWLQERFDQANYSF